MQRIYIILLLLSCTFSIYAQEVKPGSIMKDTLPKMEMSDGLNLEIPTLGLELDTRNDPLKPLKFDGYNKIFTRSIDNGLYYSLYGKLDIAPGLYTSQTAGGEIAAQINRAFLVNFGAYGMKYSHNFGGNIGSGPFNEAVLYADASYKVLPWLIVGAYGQYAAFSRYNAKHGSILHSPMIPYSGYGVHATTMFTEVFGVQSTVGREFNPINRQWQPIYGISPVINLNGLFK